MKALMQRRSVRKWKDEPVSDQDLSNLLWAACGITLQETKQSKSRRTAPSASNSQVIKVYVTRKDGIFLYEEKHHRLIQIHSENLIEHIGTQKMMCSAPIGLIYVSDYSRAGQSSSCANLLPLIAYPHRLNETHCEQDYSIHSDCRFANDSA